MTTSSARAISGTRRCRLRDGSATIRNGNAACGAIPGYMAARSDHSSALPEGSASTKSTVCPASAKTCASQTADVVLPVPGLRLTKARLRAVINAVLQCLPHHAMTATVTGGRCARPQARQRGGLAWAYAVSPCRASYREPRREAIMQYYSTYGITAGNRAC